MPLKKLAQGFKSNGESRIEPGLSARRAGLKPATLQDRNSI